MILAGEKQIFEQPFLMSESCTRFRERSGNCWSGEPIVMGGGEGGAPPPRNRRWGSYSCVSRWCKVIEVVLTEIKRSWTVRGGGRGGGGGAVGKGLLWEPFQVVVN